MLYNKSLQVICFICGHVYMFNTLMVSNIVFSDFYTAFFKSQLLVATEWHHFYSFIEVLL